MNIPSGRWEYVKEMSDTSCHCLCPTHLRVDNSFACEGDRQLAVVLTGGAVESSRPVPMCGACGKWWQRARPERVVSVALLATNGRR